MGDVGCFEIRSRSSRLSPLKSKKMGAEDSGKSVKLILIVRRLSGEKFPGGDWGKISRMSERFRWVE
ncbi:MAG: hypothetical protein A3G87_05730 [Omnitrophica bacterium RIFCSPLOWO2_12_FULL_50_11]|nr:MAG: hypothetical protein A3G87_05730 [Omnitrophica bacterium RIFCSPLOWO2_12_FULL_50_11]